MERINYRFESVPQTNLPFFYFPGPARGNLSLDSPALDGTNRPHSTTQPAARARQARASMRGRTVAWRVACGGAGQGTLIGCFFDLLRLLVD